MRPISAERLRASTDRPCAELRASGPDGLPAHFASPGGEKSGLVGASRTGPTSTGWGSRFHGRDRPVLPLSGGRNRGAQFYGEARVRIGRGVPAVPRPSLSGPRNAVAGRGSVVWSTVVVYCSLRVYRVNYWINLSYWKLALFRRVFSRPSSVMPVFAVTPFRIAGVSSAAVGQ